MKRKHVSVAESEVAPDSDESEDSHEEEDNDSSQSNEEDDEVEEPSQKKKKKIDKGQLFKPLSNEELHQLKDAENLFHSSVFKLQITELLNEVRLKERRTSEIKESIKELKTVLTKLPKGKEHELQDKSWLPKKISFPLLESPSPAKGKFKFLPPIEVKEIGSFSTGTCLRPHPCVDLQLTIPKEFFQPKDFLNHRYVQKRALYLSVIAAKLSKEDIVQDIKFSYHHGNTLKPILVVEVKGEQKSVTFNLLCCPEEGSFKYSRFHVNKNNVRQSWFNGLEVEEQIDEPPTPHYNNTILQDVGLEANNQCLQSAIESSSAVKEGISLLKIWLRQRELDVGHGGFSGFIMSSYVVYLLSRRKLNKMMSNYQIMRNTLLHLSKENWIDAGISLCGDSSDANQPTIEDFHLAFDCVFVDITGYINLCSDVKKSTFLRIKHEAELAVKFLGDNLEDSFPYLFMTPVSFTRKFDHIFHITDVTELDKTAEKLKLEKNVLDYNGNYVLAVLPELLALLQKALNKRIKLLQIKQQSVPEWNLDAEPPSISSQKVTIGVMLDPEFAFSTIDRGPAADTLEAKEFRDFWGEKSELRRFKDSSITEAVPWTTEKSADKRRFVCSLVVKEVLKRWANVLNVSYIGNQLDQVISLPIRSHDKRFMYGTGEEPHVALLQSYDNLCKVLRNLKDLPLTINSIQGISPVFRFAEVFPVLPATYFYHAKVSTTKGDCRLLPQDDKSCPPYTASCKVICLLEGSGQWPEDKDAFRRIKAALHIKLGEVLSDQQKLPVVIHTDHVNIKFENYVFRLELQYLREIALLKKVTTPDGMVKFVDNEMALTLEKNIKLLPVLTSTLHGVQQKHSSFCGTVRLAKRWLSSQMLAGHVPDIAVELIVGRLFTSPAPYTDTSNPMTGFLRFLHLVSTFDWKMSPLIVNLNSELTANDYADITSKFTKARTSLPLMFIATPQDKHQSVWTRKQPTPMIMQRLVALATECLHVLESQMMEETSLSDFKQIFRPPTTDYSVLIHLKPRQLAQQLAMVDRIDKIYNPILGADLDKDYKKCLPVFDYDPVDKYLKELQDLYGDFALFFYDKYGGKVIGVLFNPQMFKDKDFSVNHMFGRKPETVQNGHTDLVMKPNVEAIIEDFKILGGGLVSSCQILNI